MSEKPKLWRIIAGRTVKEEGYEPRQMEWEFVFGGESLAEVWQKHEALLSGFEYIKASAVVI